MNFLESIKFNFLFQFHLQMYIHGLMFSFWNKVNLLKTGSDEWLGKVKRILSAFIYNVAPVFLCRINTKIKSDKLKQENCSLLFIIKYVLP